MKNLPALKAALFLSLGLIIGKFWEYPFKWIYIISIISLFAALYLFYTGKQKNLLQISIAFLIILLGILNMYQAENMRPNNHITRFLETQSPVGLKAHLVKDPVEKSGRMELVVNADTLITGKMTVAVSGKILISIFESLSTQLVYGDRITVQGCMEIPAGLKNPGGFNYRAYLKRKGIDCIFRLDSKDPIQKTGMGSGNPLLRKIIYPIRRFMIRTIDQTSRDQERAILRALLVGEKGLLTPEVRDQFARAGIIHILAVSGLHVGYVFLILTFLLGLLRIPSQTRGIPILIGLILYVLITEAHPPVMRASIMAGTYLLGTLLARNSVPLNLLGFAALILLLIRPMDLFDIGFQLSFAAVFSILYFYPVFEKLHWIKRLKSLFHILPLGNQIFAMLLVSLSATIGTFPISAFYFNRVPLISLWINLIAIPWIGIIVALGFSTILFSTFSPWIGSVYGALNQELLSLFRNLMSEISSLSISSIVLPTPSLYLILTYYIFLLFMLHFREGKKRKILAFLFMLSVNGFIWEKALLNDSNKLTWIQFDVGQGDAALLRLPKGKNLLVDGGQSTPYFDSGKNVIAPYLRKKGIRKLDGIILTHPHNDHVGGLITILNRFHVSRIFTAGSESDSKLYRDFISTAKNQNILITEVTAPDSICYFPGVRIDLVSPPSGYQKMKDFRTLNNQSLAIQIRYGERSFLLMGDAEEEAEKDVLKRSMPVSCDVLKAGHHGSRTSSSQPFIQTSLPSCTIISVGNNNRFGHPSQIILDRFEAMGIQVLRTDQQGAIIFKSDGQKLKQVLWRIVPWCLP
jgi:competence protein ComEC